MRIYAGARQTGKSYTLLRWWLEQPTTRGILVATEAEAVNLRSQVIRMDADDHLGKVREETVRLAYQYICTYQVARRSASSGMEWAIDNVEFLLQSLVLGGTITTLTMSGSHDVIALYPEWSNA